MKITSMWQPWAQLACTGDKLVETRGRNIAYRGPLLIHAAKKWTQDLVQISNEEPFATALANAGRGPDFGAIIGMVHLTDTFQFGSDKAIKWLRALQAKDPARAKQEIQFGDWSEGRWGWVLEHPALFKKAIPLKGQQGFWDYSGPLFCPHCDRPDFLHPLFKMQGCKDCGWPLQHNSR